MNGEDPFEQRLQSRPQRQIPAAWREDILNVAKAAARPQAAPLRQAPDKSAASSWLAAWLWPAPRAWATLAAIWVAVLALNFSSREPSRPDSANPTWAPSPQSREMWRQQEELFAELVGVRWTAEVPKPAAPPPRSQRRQTYRVV